MWCIVSFVVALLTWQLITDPVFWNSWNKSSSVTSAGKFLIKTLVSSLNWAFCLLLPLLKGWSPFEDLSMIAAASHTKTKTRAIKWVLIRKTQKGWRIIVVHESTDIDQWSTSKIMTYSSDDQESKSERSSLCQSWRKRLWKDWLKFRATFSWDSLQSFLARGSSM